MDELRTQVLVLVLLHATVAQLAESALPYARYRRAKAAEAKRALEGKPADSRAARQLQLAATAPLFAEYNELMLDFAVGTLFATAFPLAPLVVLVNNTVEMRADLFKVLQLRERPVQQAVSGIGLWLPLFDAVGYCAVFTNLAILAFTSRHLDRIVSLPASSKLLLLVAVEHAVLIAKVGLSAIVPDVPAHVLSAIARRDFVTAAWVGGQRQKARHAVAEHDDAGAADSEPEEEAEGGEAQQDDDEQLCAEAEQMAAEDEAAVRTPSRAATRRTDAQASGERSRAQRRSGRAAPPTDDGARSPGSTPTRTGAAPRSERPSPPERPQPSQLFAASAAHVRSSGVSWTPFRGLAARRAPRQCTDVLCALFGLVVLGCIVALSAVGFSAGDPARLSAALDYGLDTCGQPAASRPLPLDSRLFRPSAQADARAPFVPAGRDRSGARFLFFAHPAIHLGICVPACPQPADPVDGFSPDALICTDACAGESASGKARGLGTCCFPAYATVEDGGYCRPAASVSESSLRFAFDKSDLRFTDERGRSRRAEPFWPSDEALRKVVELLDAPVRELANIAADMQASAGVTIGCTCAALGLAVLAMLAFTAAPVGALMCALLVSVVALACLTGVLWATGEGIMREHALRPLGAEYAYGYSLAVSGYVGCALTVLCALSAFYASSSILGRIGELMGEAAKVLRDVPGLQALPLVGVLGSAGVLVWWFFLAVHLASAGQFEISEAGYPLPTHDSVALRFLAGHALLGIALLFALQHGCRMAAAGTTVVWYFRKAQPSASGPWEPQPAGEAEERARAAAGAGHVASEADSEVAHGLERPAGMSAAAVARMPRPVDMPAQMVALPTLDVRTALWLTLRFHGGSVFLGALLLPLLWPLRLALWFCRPCRLNARPSIDGFPDPLAQACSRFPLLDWAFALSVDAYAEVFARDRNFLASTRSAWQQLLAQPASVALAQQTADISFFACAHALQQRVARAPLLPQP